MARGESLIRQWRLLKALQAHRFGVGIDELVGRLECSKRQVQRDLNVLQQVGFPVSYEQREFGKRFWKLSPNFIESKELIFSVTEILSLFLSQQLLSPLAGTQLGDGVSTVIDKIKAMLPKTALGYFSSLDETLLVKNMAYQDYSGHDKKIRIINQALAEGIVVNLRYNSISKNKPYDTVYHPYGMVFFNNNLYCIGHMAEYDEIRTLKISRIASVELTSDSFRRPEAFSLQTYMQGSFGIFASGKPQKVKVRLSDWAATVIREQKWHPSQAIVKDSPKAAVVEFELADTTEFKRWVLGFGRHAKVLSPKSLSAEIIEELENAAGNYAPKKKADKRKS